MFSASGYLFFVIFFTFSLAGSILTLSTLRTQRGNVYFYELSQHGIKGKSTLLDPNGIAAFDSSFKENFMPE